MLAALQGHEPLARYDGYGACPFTTARGKMVLAAFDYSLAPHLMLAFFDTQRERYDMLLLKPHELPAFSWRVMGRGLG